MMLRLSHEAKEAVQMRACVKEEERFEIEKLGGSYVRLVNNMHSFYPAAFVLLNGGKGVELYTAKNLSVAISPVSVVLAFTSHPTRNFFPSFIQSNTFCLSFTLQ